MRSNFRRLAAEHDQKLVNARLGARRHIWAYQDAQRSRYQPRGGSHRSRAVTELTNISILTLFVVVVVVSATS